MPKSQSAQICKAPSPAKPMISKNSKSPPVKQLPKKQPVVISPVKSKKSAKLQSISPTPASPSEKSTQAKNKKKSRSKAIEELMEETLEEAKVEEKAPVFPQNAVSEPDAERPKLMPKKPLSSYMQFTQVVRPQFVKQFPDLKLTQVAVLIGQKWNGLDEKEKDTYKSMSMQDKIRFETETKMLSEKGFFITKDGLRSCDVHVKFKPSKNTLMPKKPLSPFMCFNMANHTKVRGEEKQMKVVMQKISDMWTSCGAKEKKKFEIQSQKDHKRYQAQLAELDEKGFFLLDDGSKSSEYEVIAKDKKRSPPTETINAPGKRQKN